jgi:protein PhnA
MSFEKELSARSNNQCEMCGTTSELSAYLVIPKEGKKSTDFAFVCSTCTGQITENDERNTTHLHCLNDSIWSEFDAIKVVSYRLLSEMKEESWANDLLESAYLDDDTLAWAKEGMEDEFALKHVDSNGIRIKSGDTVVLIKDLDVKGTSFVAKRGTSVRNIRVNQDDVNLIEGKVNGQSIYILTQFVKK